MLSRVVERFFALAAARLHLLEPHHRHHQDQQQYHRNRRGYRPVSVDEELVPQRAADHQRIGAAQQGRDDEFAYGRDEYQQRAGDDAWHRQRQGDVEKNLPAPCAQVGGRVLQVRVELLQVGVQRQDHERQVGIDDAQIDREVVIDQLQRLIDQSQPQQGSVDDAMGIQQADPGVDPQQERNPERQDDAQQQQVAPTRRLTGNEIGHRIAQQQAQQCADRGQLDRVQIDDGVIAVLEQEQEIIQSNVDALPALRGPVDQRSEWRQCDDRVGHTDLEDDCEGREEEQQQPEIGQRQRRPQPLPAAIASVTAFQPCRPHVLNPPAQWRCPCPRR